MGQKESWHVMVQLFFGEKQSIQLLVFHSRLNCFMWEIKSHYYHVFFCLSVCLFVCFLQLGTGFASLYTYQGWPGCLGSFLDLQDRSGIPCTHSFVVSAWHAWISSQLLLNIIGCHGSTFTQNLLLYNPTTNWFWRASQLPKAIWTSQAKDPQNPLLFYPPLLSHIMTCDEIII